MTFYLYKKAAFFQSADIEMDTLGEWSDGDDEWVWEVDEWEWSDPEADDIIRNVEIDELDVDDWEWSDSEADDIIRNIEIGDMNVDDGECSDPEADDIIRNIQTGDGKKRKSEDEVEDPEQDFYVKESVKKHNSKKFRMTATDHTIRFNNNVSNLDLLDSYQRTLEIFGHLLNDVTEGMNENDQVRFVLRSDQLETPISIPFMPLYQLTTERIFFTSSTCSTIES